MNVPCRGLKCQRGTILSANILIINELMNIFNPVLFVFLFFRLIKGGRIESTFDYGLLNFFQNLNRGTSDQWCVLPAIAPAYG